MNGLSVAKIALLIFLIALSFIVIYKAVCIPVTFDESSTFGITEQPLRQVMMNLNWDNSPSNWPNNHILNSLLVKASKTLFGIQPWEIRLPNILSFFLFGIGIYILSVKFFSRSWWLLLMPVVLMFCNPYLLDFYSVARGYGMGSALMSCSIIGLLLYVSSAQMRWYYVTILFAALAVYAQFTFLLYWVALHILLTVFFVIDRTQSNQRRWHIVLSTAIVAIAFWALWTYPLIHIQEGVKHDYPLDKGFFDATVLNSVSNFCYGKSYGSWFIHILAWMAIGAIIFSGIYCFIKIRKQSSSQNMKAYLSDPFIIVFALFILVWGINMLQVYVSHTTYLTARIALIYYVLFIFVLIFLVRDIAVNNPFAARAGALTLMLFFIINFSRAVNLKSIYEWSYDAYTYDVVGYIDKYRLQHPEVQSISIKLGGHFYPSFFFYHYMNYKNMRWLDITTRFDTVSQSLFYYATAKERPKLINYNPVQTFGTDSQVLMIHK